MSVFSFTKNAVKSFAYHAPMAAVNKTFAMSRELTEAIRDSKDIAKEEFFNVKTLFKDKIIDGVLNKQIKDLKRAAKTGKFYKSEEESEIDSDVAKALGMDMSEFTDLDTSDDFGFGSDGGDDFGGDDFGGGREFNDSNDLSNDSFTKNQIDNSKTFNDNRTINLQKDNGATDYIASATVANSKIAIATAQMMNKSMNRLGEIGIKHISIASQSAQTLEGIKFTSGSMLTILQQTTTLQNDMLQQLKEINKGIQVQLGTLGIDIDGNKLFKPLERSFGDETIDSMGNINFGNYFKRLGGKTKGMIDDVGMFGMMIKPLEMGIDAVVDKLIPEKLKESASRVDTMFSTLGNNIFSMFEDWSKDTGTGFGSILKRSLGGFLKPGRGSDASISEGLATYNKGAIPFDGITKKAITEVIPRLLSSIDAGIRKQSLGQEKIYDYEKGRFTTVGDLSKKENIERNRSLEIGAFADLKERVMKSFDVEGMTKEAQKALQEEITSAIKNIASSSGNILDAKFGNVSEELKAALEHVLSTSGYKELSELTKAKDAYKASGRDTAYQLHSSPTRSTLYGAYMPGQEKIDELVAQNKSLIDKLTSGKNAIKAGSVNEVTYQTMLKGGKFEGNEQQKKLFEAILSQKKEIEVLQETLSNQAFDINELNKSNQAVASETRRTRTTAQAQETSEKPKFKLRENYKSQTSRQYEEEKARAEGRLDKSYGAIDRVTDFISSIPHRITHPIDMLSDSLNFVADSVGKFFFGGRGNGKRKKEGSSSDDQEGDRSENDGLLGKVRSSFTRAINWFKGIGKSIKAKFNEYFNKVTNWFSDKLFKPFGSWVEGAWGKLSTAFSKNITTPLKMWAFGKDGKNGFFNRMKESTLDFFGDIKDTFSKNITVPIKSALFGRDGKSGAIGSLKASMRDAWRNFRKRIGILFSPVGNWAKELLGTWKDSLTGKGAIFSKDGKLYKKLIAPLSDKLFGDKAIFGKDGFLFGEKGVFGKDGKLLGKDGLFGENGLFGRGMAKLFGRKALFGEDGKLFGRTGLFGASGSLFGPKGLFGREGKLFGPKGVLGPESYIGKTIDSLFGDKGLFRKDGALFGKGGYIDQMTDKFTQKIWEPAKDWIRKEVWEPAKKWVSEEIWNPAKDWFKKEIWTPLSTFVKDKIWTPLTEKLKDFGSQVIEPAKKWVKEQIWEPARDWFKTQIWEPATTFVKDKVWEPFKKWTKDTLGNFTKTIWRPAKAFLNKELWQPFKKTIAEDWQRAKKWSYENLVKPLQGVMAPFVTEFKLQLGNLKKWLKEDFWKKGVMGSVHALDDAFGSIFGKKFSTMMRENVLDPMKKTLTAFKEGVYKIVGSILKAPVNFISGIAKDLRQKHLKQGYMNEAGQYQKLSMTGEVISNQYQGKAVDWRGNGGYIDTKSLQYTTERATNKAGASNEFGFGTDATAKVGVAPEKPVEKATPSNAWGFGEDATTKAGTTGKGAFGYTTERATNKAGASNEFGFGTDATAKVGVVSGTAKAVNVKPSATKAAIPEKKTEEEKPAGIISSIRNPLKKEITQQQAYQAALDTAKHTKRIRENTNSILRFMRSHLSGLGRNVYRLVKKFKAEKLLGDGSKEKLGKGEYRTFFGRIKDAILHPIQSLKRGVTGLFKRTTRAVTSVVKNAIGAVGKAITGVISGIGKFLSGILNLAKTLWKGVELAGKAISFVAKGVFKAGEFLAKGLTKVTTGLIKGTGWAIKKLWELTPSITTIKKGLTTFGKAVSEVTKAVWGFLKVTGSLLGSLVKGVGKLAGGALSGVGSLFGISGRGVSNLLSKKIQRVAIVSSIPLGVFQTEKPKGYVFGKPDMAEVINTSANAGSLSSGIKNFVGGIKDKWSSFKEAAKEKWAIFKGALGLGTPVAKAEFGFGQDILASAGKTDDRNTIAGQARQRVAAAKEAVTKKWQDSILKVNTITSKAASGMKAGIGKMLLFLTSVLGPALAFLKAGFAKILGKMGLIKAGTSLAQAAAGVGVGGGAVARGAGKAGRFGRFMRRGGKLALIAGAGYLAYDTLFGGDKEAQAATLDYGEEGEKHTFDKIEDASKTEIAAGTALGAANTAVVAAPLVKRAMEARAAANGVSAATIQSASGGASATGKEAGKIDSLRKKIGDTIVSFKNKLPKKFADKLSTGMIKGIVGRMGKSAIVKIAAKLFSGPLMPLITAGSAVYSAYEGYNKADSIMGTGPGTGYRNLTGSQKFGVAVANGVSDLTFGLLDPAWIAKSIFRITPNKEGSPLTMNEKVRDVDQNPVSGFKERHGIDLGLGKQDTDSAMNLEKIDAALARNAEMTEKYKNNNLISESLQQQRAQLEKQRDALSGGKPASGGNVNVNQSGPATVTTVSTSSTVKASDNSALFDKGKSAILKAGKIGTETDYRKLDTHQLDEKIAKLDIMAGEETNPVLKFAMIKKRNELFAIKEEKMIEDEALAEKQETMVSKLREKMSKKNKEKEEKARRRRAQKARVQGSRIEKNFTAENVGDLASLSSGGAAIRAEAEAKAGIFGKIGNFLSSGWDALKQGASNWWNRIFGGGSSNQQQDGGGSSPIAAGTPGAATGDGVKYSENNARSSGGSLPPNFAELGSVIKKYESGNRGVAMVSSGKMGKGKPDPGGISYGTFQLASLVRGKPWPGAKWKPSAYEFRDEYAKFFPSLQGLTPGTPAFSAEWVNLAKTRKSELEAAEKDYVRRHLYDLGMKAWKKAGMDPNRRSYQEMVWSASVQHGGGGFGQNILPRAIRFGLSPNATPEQNIWAVYKARADFFPPTRDRYLNKEVYDILALEKRTGNMTPEQLAAQGGEHGEGNPNNQSPVQQGAPQAGGSYGGGEGGSMPVQGGGSAAPSANGMPSMPTQGGGGGGGGGGEPTFAKNTYNGPAQAKRIARDASNIGAISHSGAPKTKEEAIQRLQALGVKAYNSSGGGGYKGVAPVNLEFLKRFTLAAEEYKQKYGTNISITSAWRSAGDQARLRSRSKYAAKGTSRHQLGIAIDIGNASGGGVHKAGWGRGTAGDKFEEIGRKYGIFRPLRPKAGEEQHFEPMQGAPSFKSDTPELQGQGEGENSSQETARPAAERTPAAVEKAEIAQAKANASSEGAPAGSGGASYGGGGQTTPVQQASAAPSQSTPPPLPTSSPTPASAPTPVQEASVTPSPKASQPTPAQTTPISTPKPTPTSSSFSDSELSKAGIKRGRIDSNGIYRGDRTDGELLSKYGSQYTALMQAWNESMTPGRYSLDKRRKDLKSYIRILNAMHDGVSKSELDKIIDEEDTKLERYEQEEKGNVNKQETPVEAAGNVNLNQSAPPSQTQTNVSTSSTSSQSTAIEKAAPKTIEQQAEEDAMSLPLVQMAQSGKFRRPDELASTPKQEATLVQKPAETTTTKPEPKTGHKFIYDPRIKLDENGVPIFDSTINKNAFTTLQSERRMGRDGKELSQKDLIERLKKDSNNPELINAFNAMYQGTHGSPKGRADEFHKQSLLADQYAREKLQSDLRKERRVSETKLKMSNKQGGILDPRIKTDASGLPVFDEKLKYNSSYVKAYEKLKNKDYIDRKDAINALNRAHWQAYGKPKVGEKGSLELILQDRAAQEKISGVSSYSTQEIIDYKTGDIPYEKEKERERRRALREKSSDSVGDAASSAMSLLGGTKAPKTEEATATPTERAIPKTPEQEGAEAAISLPLVQMAQKGEFHKPNESAPEKATQQATATPTQKATPKTPEQQGEEDAMSLPIVQMAQSGNFRRPDEPAPKKESPIEKAAPKTEEKKEKAELKKETAEKKTEEATKPKKAPKSEKKEEKSEVKPTEKKGGIFAGLKDSAKKAAGELKQSGSSKKKSAADAVKDAVSKATKPKKKLISDAAKTAKGAASKADDLNKANIEEKRKARAKQKEENKKFIPDFREFGLDKRIKIGSDGLPIIDPKVASIYKGTATQFADSFKDLKNDDSPEIKKIKARNFVETLNALHREALDGKNADWKALKFSQSRRNERIKALRAQEQAEIQKEEGQAKLTKEIDSKIRDAISASTAKNAAPAPFSASATPISAPAPSATAAAGAAPIAQAPAATSVPSASTSAPSTPAPTPVTSAPSGGGSEAPVASAAASPASTMSSDMMQQGSSVQAQAAVAPTPTTNLGGGDWKPVAGGTGGLDPAKVDQLIQLLTDIAQNTKATSDGIGQMGNKLGQVATPNNQQSGSTANPQQYPTNPYIGGSTSQANYNSYVNNGGIPNTRIPNKVDIIARG